MRRRRRVQPSCADCRAPIVWFRNEWTGRWQTYNPKPLAAHDEEARGARPVWAGRTWRPIELEAELASTIPDEEARETVRDLPWYHPHACTRWADIPKEADA